MIGTDSYIVNTTVDDTDIGQVAEGDQATVTPTGATTVDYGTVASIGLIATETSDVATFPVVIDVTGDPTGLYAGSTADVSIIVKQLNNVVEVPTAAITLHHERSGDRHRGQERQARQCRRDRRPGGAGRDADHVRRVGGRQHCRARRSSSRAGPAHRRCRSRRLHPDRHRRLRRRSGRLERAGGGGFTRTGAGGFGGAAG